MMHNTWLVLPVVLCACLDPRVGDDPGYSHRVLPASAKVPSVDDDVRASGVISSNDGLPADVVPISEAFLDGQPVSYWDFGAASNTVGPVWVLRKHGSGRDEDVEHLPIVDTAPGDANYGPLRHVFAVYVTDAYAGELITSFEALEDATELGLVEEPEPTGEYVVWPVTRSGAAVELPAGQGEADEVYYQGKRVACLRLDKHGVTLGEIMVRRGRASANTGYVIRRQWETDALDEAVLEADLNGDGDMRDSNLIFSVGPAAAGRYTGLVSTTEVVVAGSYGFGDVTAPAGLFPPAEGGGKSPPADIVIEVIAQGDTLLRPILSDAEPAEDAQ